MLKSSPMGPYLMRYIPWLENQMLEFNLKHILQRLESLNSSQLMVIRSRTHLEHILRRYTEGMASNPQEQNHNDKTRTQKRGDLGNMMTIVPHNDKEEST